MTVLKAATKDMRGLPAGEELAGTARTARCAAFACGAALVQGTQEKESIFAIPLKGSSNADPSGSTVPCCSPLSACFVQYSQTMALTTYVA